MTFLSLIDTFGEHLYFKASEIHRVDHGLNSGGARINGTTHVKQSVMQIMNMLNDSLVNGVQIVSPTDGDVT